jgi:hypothetical protein
MLTGLEFVWWFHLLFNVLYHASVLIFISIRCCFHDAPFCKEDAPKISISYIHFYPLGVIFGFGALHILEKAWACFIKKHVGVVDRSCDLHIKLDFLV